MSDTNATAHLIPGPLKVYLAGRLEDRYTLRDIRQRLAARGCIGVARWLDADPADLDDVGVSLDHAFSRMEDILGAHVVIVYSERATHRSGTGEKHAELAVALFMRKPVVLIGHPENVFHCHSSVHRVAATVTADRLADIVTLAAVHGTPIPEAALMVP